MSITRIKRVEKILQQIEETASESMTQIDLTKDQEVTYRWIAERNRRTQLRVQLYAAADVANSIDTIDLGVRG